MLLVRQGLHGVFRPTGQRVIDFTPTREVPPRWDRKALGQGPVPVGPVPGPTDRVVEWYKPYVRPEWITVEEYAALPTFLPVRECRYEVDRPGVRVRTVTPVSTLLDAGAYALDARNCTGHACGWSSVSVT